ncbi:hypothetical protein I6A60_09290 [Frankia sp. AgB1.9]|nr:MULTISPECIES: hypothetical protein [unclassified Frankia]MBL7548067.1 hypothetical protein [Frankia sp. AgB1.9]MBL7617936.1 hypothetical protein [Frankia sp. AgB1.8]
MAVIWTTGVTDDRAVGGAAGWTGLCCREAADGPVVTGGIVPSGTGA